MNDNNKSDPATKADLQELATKADLKKLEQATKADLKKLEQATKADLQELAQTTKGDLDAVKIELKSDITRLDGGLKDVSGEILKVNFRLDRIEHQLENKVATKDDFNRLYNLVDSIAGDIKNYQRQDVLRGDKIMAHDEKINNHESRITLLETPK